MKALFETSHSMNQTTYTGKEENPVFSYEALLAAKNIQPDKNRLKRMYYTLRTDKFARSLQKRIKDIDKSNH